MSILLFFMFFYIVYGITEAGKKRKKHLFLEQLLSHVNQIEKHLPFSMVRLNYPVMEIDSASTPKRYIITQFYLFPTL